ncbi:MAG: hypothetical protein JWR59_639, partial [Brevundimonas sp.]|nr:hypothetical protein [Brevundimonas sp.]
FTGDLAVDPAHLRDLRQRAPDPAGSDAVQLAGGSDRARRIRDAVEAALSDIILLGTEKQVRLAERAARDLVSGRPVQTHELVVSLRDFIREALDLDPVPADLELPRQGPTRPSGSGTKGGGAKEGSGGGGGGGGGGSGGMGGGGMGGGGMGSGSGSDTATENEHHSR